MVPYAELGTNAGFEFHILCVGVERCREQNEEAHDEIFVMKILMIATYIPYALSCKPCILCCTDKKVSS